MTQNTYTIEATVRRAGSITRRIEWDYSGKGAGTHCWNAWRKMRSTNATMDTQEPFVSAAILRNGECVESVGAHIVAEG